MNDISQPQSKENSSRRAVFIGYILTGNGLLFTALGVYLVILTRSWQAMAFIGTGLIASIGSWVGTVNIKHERKPDGGWVLFTANVIGPFIAGFVFSRFGLISAPYILIASFIIIRMSIVASRRMLAGIIAIATALFALVTGIIYLPWTLYSQLVLTMGPIFLIGSLGYGFIASFFRTIFPNLRVRQKLLGSVSSIFLLLIVFLTGFYIWNLYQRADEEELQQLSSIYNNYNSYTATLEDTAASVALSIADRQDVAELLRARNRQGLLDLLTPLFDELKTRNNIVHMYVEDVNGIVFVRINNPGEFGDDISYRRMATAVSLLRDPVAGVEIGPSRLGIRGMAPMADGSDFIGMTEVGIDFDQNFIEALKERSGADYTMWLTHQAATPAGLQAQENSLPSPHPDLFYYASTNPANFQIPEAAYTRVLTNLTPELHYVTHDNEDLVVYVAPLMGFGDREIGVIEISVSRTQTLANIRLGVFTAIGLALLTSVIGFTALLLVSQTVILRPLEQLISTSRQQLAGDLSIRVPVVTEDELGELGATLNDLTDSLSSSVQELEGRVESRTADLELAGREIEDRAEQFEAIAQVSRNITTIQTLDELLPRTTNMISEFFGFYHAGIFLLDETREFAVLRAANSDGGRRMLERNHQLEVEKTSIVGFVTSTGTPRIALDTGVDAVYFDNPDLPETRSEMALPLIAGGQIVGALDVQSTEPNAFSQEDINILSIMADLVSAAIRNVRLIEDTREALERSEAAYRQVTRQAWLETQEQEALIGYRFDGSQLERLTQPINGEQSDPKKEVLSIPVKLRGETIGRLRINPPKEGHNWTDDEIVIIRATAERVAMAAENARLVLESQKHASKEQLIGEISSKISSAINLDSIMQITLREMGRYLPGAEISIQVDKD